MKQNIFAVAALVLGCALYAPLRAQEASDEAVGKAEAAMALEAAPDDSGIDETPEEQDAAPTKGKKAVPRDPNKGVMTNLPIPRYVSLKGREGNARRGPGLTHRIDWVFKASGMPLRITAEHEHWRRIEDSEGMGGWVHYSLLSGVRTVLVVSDDAQFLEAPEVGARVAFKAERNVIGKLMKCQIDWCRVSTDGDKGWIQKTALWGVDAGEILQ